MRDMDRVLAVEWVTTQGCPYKINAHVAVNGRDFPKH
jgi:hypothetical protein